MAVISAPRCNIEDVAF